MILTPSQQEKLLAFVKGSNIYQVYYPMLIIMIGTGLRAGELIGLTWTDVDMEKREIRIGEQLVYKNYGDGCRFHDSTPKTDAGVRVIPMSNDVRKAFAEQRKINFMRGIRADIEIGGKCGFIFTSKSGRPGSYRERNCKDECSQNRITPDKKIKKLVSNWCQTTFLRPK